MDLQIPIARWIGENGITPQYSIDGDQIAAEKKGDETILSNEKNDEGLIQSNNKNGEEWILPWRMQVDRPEDA